MVKKALCILLSVIICFSLPIFGFAVDSAENNGFNSNENSTVENSQPILLKKSLPKNVNTSERILLIQDRLPWDQRTNTIVLDEIGEPYRVVSTNEFLNVNLWDYDVVIFANDQTFTTYQNYSQFKEYLELFAEMGGVIVFGAGDYGWGNGALTAELPGGVTKTKNYSYRDYVSKSNHPIVTGELTNDGVLTDDDLYEYYCSHGSFIESSLPVGHQVILRASNDDAPTLVEYPVGNGLVIASTLTWEFNYEHGGESHPNGGYRGKYSKIALKDMYLYAIEKSEESQNNKYTINVKGIDSSGNEIMVSDAYVTLFDNSNGQSREIYSVKTNANGEAKISVAGLTVNQLKNATISAYKTISKISAIDGNDRNPLFNQFGTENNHPIRLIYQLHSEKLDTNGNWRGEKLPKSNESEIDLLLSEPRLLANLSVAYMDDSTDPNYQQKVKDTMNYVSTLMAQATDGHVFINKVILQPVYNRYDFFDTSKWESMADIQIQTKIKDDGTWWNNVQIHSNAHVNGFYFDDTYTIRQDYMDNFSNLKDADSYLGRSSYCRVQMSGKEGAGWNNDLGTRAYSTTIVHELGHYLLGFYDEYLDADGNNRDVHPDGDRFGLMDNQHDDIEISRANSDYSYLSGDYSDRNQITRQVAVNEMPCEDYLSDILKYEDRLNVIESSLKATYNKNTQTNDRTAEYSYAQLTDDDFIIAGSNYAMRNTNSLALANQSEDTQKLMGRNVFYTSYSQNVIAYINGNSDITVTFTPQEDSLIFDTYFSVNEPTMIEIESLGDVCGEIYSEISAQANIDFTTLSWYRFAKNKWIKIDSEISRDSETKNYGVLCDFCGEGLYVVMAESAKSNNLKPISIKEIRANNNKDASAYIEIDNSNSIENVSYIEVHYSEDRSNNSDYCSKIFDSDINIIPIQFEKANTRYYVCVIAHGVDGSIACSEYKEFVSKEADSDNDGIPDWYCDKYLLWGMPGENKDIANSDDNENGLTNLEEYILGNDPTMFSESYVRIKEENITIFSGQTYEPDIYFAQGRKICYLSSDQSIASITETGTIYAHKEGQAVITAIVVDDFGEPILDSDGKTISDELNVTVIECSCKCHKTNFFNKLIWMVTNFFNRIFKKNQICNCGVAHY